MTCQSCAGDGYILESPPHSIWPDTKPCPDCRTSPDAGEVEAVRPEVGLNRYWCPKQKATISDYGNGLISRLSDYVSVEYRGVSIGSSNAKRSQINGISAYRINTNMDVPVRAVRNLTTAEEILITAARAWLLV